MSKDGNPTKPPDDKPKADPTKDAPFKVDPDSEDMASVRYDLDEDELKEIEDRRK